MQPAAKPGVPGKENWTGHRFLRRRYMTRPALYGEAKQKKSVVFNT
jgi:hypothetical protein